MFLTDEEKRILDGAEGAGRGGVAVFEGAGCGRVLLVARKPEGRTFAVQPSQMPAPDVDVIVGCGPASPAAPGHCGTEDSVGASTVQAASDAWVEASATGRAAIQPAIGGAAAGAGRGASCCRMPMPHTMPAIAACTMSRASQARPMRPIQSRSGARMRLTRKSAGIAASRIEAWSRRNPAPPHHAASAGSQPVNLPRFRAEAWSGRDWRGGGAGVCGACMGGRDPVSMGMIPVVMTSASIISARWRPCPGQQGPGQRLRGPFRHFAGRAMPRAAGP